MMTEDRVFLAIIILVFVAGLFFLVKAIRDEEVAKRKRRELARTRPLEALAEEIETTTRSLYRWSRWLAFVAFAFVPLFVLGACRDDDLGARDAVLGGIIWLGVAVALWYVRD